MGLIDADVLIDEIKKDTQKVIKQDDKVGSFWLGYAAGLVIKQPTIQPEKAQLSQEGTTKDTISRQAAIDALQKCRKHCIDPFDSYHIDIQDAENQLSKVPAIQPEQTDIDAREAVYNLAEKIGIHQLFALTVELRGEPIQPEPQWIPVSERLPEVHESGNSVSGIYMQSNPVLVYGTCEYEDNAQFHVVTYCDDLDGNTYWSAELDAITVSGVLAWMPLPEPYKPNNE